MRAMIRCFVLIYSLGCSYPVVVAAGEPNSAAREQGDEQHTAYASLHVAYREPRLLIGSDHGRAVDRSEFDVFRRTQTALIRSRFVLSAALRQPSTVDLKLVKNHKDPLEWLVSAIDVGFPDDCEILRVSLRGSNPTELKVLVNAVTQAYLNEVVNGDRMKRLERLSQLEGIHNEIEQKNRVKRENLRKLSELLGIGDPSVLSIKQRLALEESSALRKELRQVKLELIKAGLRHASVQKLISDAENLPIAEMAATDQIESTPFVKMLQERVAKLRDRIEQKKRAGEDDDSPILKSLHDELALAMRELEKARSEVGVVVRGRMREMAKEEAMASARQLDEHITVLTEQQRFLEVNLADLNQEIEKAGVNSIELESLKQDIERADKVTQAVASELETLRLELRAPPRVILIHDAQVETSKE